MGKKPIKSKEASSSPDALPIIDIETEQFQQDLLASAREMVECEQERLRFRSLLLDGALSPVSGDADKKYFEDLRTKHRPD